MDREKVRYPYPLTVPAALKENISEISALYLPGSYQHPDDSFSPSS